MNSQLIRACHLLLLIILLELTLDEALLVGLGLELELVRVLLSGLSNVVLEVLNGDGNELLIQRGSGLQPDTNDDEQDHGEVGGGCSQGAEANNQELLDKGTSRLSERVADDINGSLTLHLGLIIKGNVGHLLAGVEQGVLGSLGEDVLGSTDNDGGIERSHTNHTKEGSPHARGEEKAEEDDTCDEEHCGGNLCCHTPAVLLEDDAGRKHQEEGDNTGAGGEVTHECGVLVGVGELSLNLTLPGHFDQVDTDTICYHQQCKVTDVWGATKEPQALAHAHLGLLLLLLLLNATSFLHLGDDDTVHQPVDGHNHQTSNTNNGHHSTKRHTPAVNTRWKLFTDLGEDLHGTSGEDQCDVGTKTEQGVELLCFVNGGNLVGESPEEDGNHDGTPQLSHDVEQAVGPVAENGDRTKEALSGPVKGSLTEFCGVENITHGIHDERERSEESDEGEDADVEDHLDGQDVDQPVVQQHESDSHGQVHPSLEERNNFGSATRRGDDQHILGITKNRVVEQDAEEHQTQRKDLLDGKDGHSQKGRLLLLSGITLWCGNIGGLSLNLEGLPWACLSQLKTCTEGLLAPEGVLC
mmetsp:Transcript_39229/g.47508  ORF Transcript_39229/g.47508 Transcript_39229/m.47508 type:complete len:583 (+) Transcript_39229:534-2282(+)